MAHPDPTPDATPAAASAAASAASSEGMLAPDPDKPLVVTQIMEGALGGVERQARLMMEHLPARGIQLRFLLGGDRDPHTLEVARWLGARGAVVDVLPMGRSIRPLRDRRALGMIRDLLRQSRPDLVHTHASKGGYLGRRAAWRLGLPVVHTPHVFAFEMDFHPLWRWLFTGLERRAARWCDSLVLLSDRQEERTARAGIGTAASRVVIPNGIDATRFAPASAVAREDARRALGIDPEGFVVGVAARLCPQKDLPTFLRAASRIRAGRDRGLFLIAGDGPERERLGALAARLELGDAVRFLGPVEEIESFYHALDLFVLPSRWEGCPYALLEAMACGLPVVATRTDGALSVLEEGETGLLVPPGDPQALAQAILALERDPEKAAYLGSWGRATVERCFAVARWADETAALYRAVLAHRAGVDPRAPSEILDAGESESAAPPPPARHPPSRAKSRRDRRHS